MTINIPEPDFSGDDFMNDTEIQKSRAALEAHKRNIENSILLLRNNLGIKNAQNQNLQTFSSFKTLNATMVESFESFQLCLPLHISIAKYFSSYPIAKAHNSGTDQYLFGLFSLNKPFPNTYICRETLREKINDLFINAEVDFEYNRIFSKKFFVLTDDKIRLTNLFQFKELDILAAFPEMEIEIQNKTCLFRHSRRAISPDEANAFTELAKSLVTILN
jgi:hypothetical protein